MPDHQQDQPERQPEDDRDGSPANLPPRGNHHGRIVRTLFALAHA